MRVAINACSFREYVPCQLFKKVFSDLLEAVRLEDDLRRGVADDIASELFAFYDQACIADAGRDVLICQVPSDERTTFALCDQVF